MQNIVISSGTNKVLFSQVVYHFQMTTKFLLLVRCVPNVAKRSIWDQCKKKYILRTDRPTHRRPTSRGCHLGKFQMAISPRGVVRSTSCLVLRWGFRGRRIEWCYCRLDQIQQVMWEKQCARSIISIFLNCHIRWFSILFSVAISWCKVQTQSVLLLIHLSIYLLLGSYMILSKQSMRMS